VQPRGGASRSTTSTSTRAPRAWSHGSSWKRSSRQPSHLPADQLAHPDDERIEVDGLGEVAIGAGGEAASTSARALRAETKRTGSVLNCSLRRTARHSSKPSIHDMFTSRRRMSGRCTWRLEMSFTPFAAWLTS
jgi:hypothetical protein